MCRLNGNLNFIFVTESLELNGKKFMKLIYSVKNECEYKTVRDIAYDYFMISKKYLPVIKHASNILLNGKPAWPDMPVKTGDTVVFDLCEYEEVYEKPEPMDLKIIFEDEAFIAFNKPPYMPVHTSIRHQSGTLANGAAAMFASRGIKNKIRIINRLDRNTSGICLVAKNRYAQERISQQIKAGMLYKEYRGIVEGILEKTEGIISSCISRADDGTIKRVCGGKGKESVTQYQVLSNNGNFSELKFIMHTGRTHQIRVHMAMIGHPIAGDEMYGFASEDMRRQALYCSCLKFTHPLNNNVIEIRVPMPNDIAQFYGSIKTQKEI